MLNGYIIQIIVIQVARVFERRTPVTELLHLCMAALAHIVQQTRGEEARMCRYLVPSELIMGAGVVSIQTAGSPSLGVRDTGVGMPASTTLIQAVMQFAACAAPNSLVRTDPFTMFLR